MPPIEVQGRTQKAVLWERSDYDDYGKYTVKTPVELVVRWEDGQRQSSGAQDSVIAITGKVYVDRLIPIGSIFWKGALKDIPASPTNLKEVIDLQEVPDLKGRNTQRIAIVETYNNQLPTVA